MIISCLLKGKIYVKEQRYRINFADYGFVILPHQPAVTFDIRIKNSSEFSLYALARGNLNEKVKFGLCCTTNVLRLSHSGKKL